MRKMKTNLRLILAAVVLAGILALGFNHGAWAGSLRQGTVPSCMITITATGSTCRASATGSGFIMSDTGLAEDVYPMVPGSLNFGPAVDLTANGGLVEVCFPDIDTPAVGNIWHWMTAADWLAEYKTIEPGRWVYWPTYHKAGGLTCTMTEADGIYTIEY
jgi:hypothetical protein